MRNGVINDNERYVMKWGKAIGKVIKAGEERIG